jgi:TPR repeat protein
VARDTARAQQYFRLAARKGEPQAEYNLALMYLNGDGVTVERAAAQFWFALAAAHGSPQAKAHLLVFSHAQDATPDAKKYAALYFNELAAAGGIELQNLVGELYSNGLIVPADRLEARRWFDFAARQGDARAAERLKMLGQP